MNQTQTPNQIPSSPPAAPAAVWSLVLGMLSILCFGAFAGIPAIICGHSARAKIRQTPSGCSGNGLALAGLIMGYFSTAITVLVLLLLGLLLAAGYVSSLSPFIYALF